MVGIRALWQQQPSLFFLLAICSQKEKLKTKSAKIKCFVSFSIAIIRRQFEKNRQIYITRFKCVAINIEGCFFFKLLNIFWAAVASITRVT